MALHIVRVVAFGAIVLCYFGVGLRYLFELVLKPAYFIGLLVGVLLCFFEQPVLPNQIILQSFNFEHEVEVLRVVEVDVLYFLEDDRVF